MGTGSLARERMDMRRFTHTVRNGCLVMLALLAGTAAAEQIYRSVDAEGNVTFSSTPPPDAAAVEEVSVQPGPSAEAQREARERMQRQEATASEIGESRADRIQQQKETSPAAAGEVVREVPQDQYYGNNYRKPVQERPVQLPERPVQLPVRPVQPPARPVQLPARPVPR